MFACHVSGKVWGCVMKRGMRTAVSRRRLLQGAAAGLFGAAGAAVLAACGETQVVTKEVIKEVPVERVVTKEVIKEVPVETVVTKEVIKEVVVERVVTKEVIKEVMVTAAPAMEQEMTGPVSGGTITVGRAPRRRASGTPMRSGAASITPSTTTSGCSCGTATSGAMGGCRHCQAAGARARRKAGTRSSPPASTTFTSIPTSIGTMGPR